MNKTFLIFKHEFLHMIRRPGFIVMTLIVPFLGLLAIVVGSLVSGAQPPVTEVVNVGYVDEAGGFESAPDSGGVRLVIYKTPDGALKALLAGEIKDYFVIPKDYISSGQIRLYTLEKQFALPQNIQAAINDLLVGNMLRGVPPATIERVNAPSFVITTTLTATGAVAPAQGGPWNFLIPGVFSILFALSMIFSSTYMVQGLGGEKENRLIEILLSSVSTRQLLSGKVLGLGAAGLVQVTVWAAVIPLLFSLASSTIGGAISAIQLPAGFLVLGIVYFVLGYLLFAVLAASVGAISPSTQEGQQLSTIYTMFALAPLWFMSLIMFIPDNPVWAVFSIFPLTAPVLMMVRMGLTAVPAWQIAASLAVLVLSVVGGLLLAAKLFRSSLLMYGKRSKIKKIVHTLKNENG